MIVRFIIAAGMNHIILFQQQQQQQWSYTKYHIFVWIQTNQSVRIAHPTPDERYI